MIRSKINVNIKGNNIERFIKRLKSNNIDIISINYISRDEINVKIYKNDYDKLLSIKTIYDISIINYMGAEKIKINIFSNRFVIISILIGFIFLYFLSNIIFNIEIITSDNDLKSKLYMELKEYGIEEYKLKKSYESIQNIKKNILSKYRNEIEWLEIEVVGTKYIVKFEPRIINNNIQNKSFRHIIAKKDSVIKSINISSGQIIKNINSYVKKGDIIVSGYIDLNGNIKDTVASNGVIYGEVWYKVKIDYPYKYYEEYKTGKYKNVFVFKFLNTNIELLNFNKYNTKFVKDKTLLRNNLFPIKFILEKQYQTKKIIENNNEKELIEKAILYANKKIEKRLNEGEYINSYKVLNKVKKDNSIELNIFYSVIENITDYQIIERYENLEE